jgi:hypothetical protein
VLLQYWFDNHPDAQLEALNCNFFVALNKLLERHSYAVSLEAVEILALVSDSVVP